MLKILLKLKLLAQVLNIRLSNSALIKNITLILKNDKSYGSFKTDKNYNIEFVSANPTGPMHVGHCRGAIYGDVLANLLKFNGNKVTKNITLMITGIR